MRGKPWEPWQRADRTVSVRAFGPFNQVMSLIRELLFYLQTRKFGTLQTPAQTSGDEPRPFRWSRQRAPFLENPRVFFQQATPQGSRRFLGDFQHLPRRSHHADIGKAQESMSPKTSIGSRYQRVRQKPFPLYWDPLGQEVPLLPPARKN